MARCSGVVTPGTSVDRGFSAVTVSATWVLGFLFYWLDWTCSFRYSLPVEANKRRKLWLLSRAPISSHSCIRKILIERLRVRATAIVRRSTPRRQDTPG